jgi:PPIC-type PPIASE domain
MPIQWIPRTMLGLCALVVLPVCTGLAACGGASVPDGVVVRIGSTAITKTMLHHWASVMSAGSGAERGEAPQQKALAYLISSEWLIDEGVSQGPRFSEREVRQQVAARRAASFPDGEVEFHKFLAATHRSAADVEFEAKVELASSRLRQLITRMAGNVTSAQIATYYKRHRQLFVTPETRVTKFAGRKTKTAIDKLKREVESGKDLTSAAQRAVGEVTMTVSSPPGRRNSLEKVIYAAKPNVLADPARFGIDYYLFKVVKIFPPTTQALAQVEGTIRKQLVEEAQRRSLAAFVKMWRAKWMTRTDCSTRYVVQKCRQYAGPLAPEDPLGLN